MTVDLVFIPNSVLKVLYHQRNAPPKLLEISKNIKKSDILRSILACKKIL